MSRSRIRLSFRIVGLTAVLATFATASGQADPSIAASCAEAAEPLFSEGSGTFHAMLPASTAIIPSDTPIILSLGQGALASAGLSASSPDISKFYSAARINTGNTRQDAISIPTPVQFWIKPSADDKTGGTLLLAAFPDDKLPLVTHWPHMPLTLLVAICNENESDGKDKTYIISSYRIIKIVISDRIESLISAMVLTVVIYILAALSLPGRRGLKRLSPIMLAEDFSGRASLSQIQVIFFSVVVLFLVSYIWLRTGTLASLSQTVLLLLGIAGLGSVSGAAVASNTQRLSLANSAWLINKRWTLPGGSRAAQPSWRDLFSTNDSFDPYKFQMFAFSGVIGVALLGIGLDQLATFDIPTTLLGVIGLSQVTYVAGKIVGPPTVADLNDQLDKLRAAQSDFLDATAGVWPPNAEPKVSTAKLEKAITDDPTKWLQFQSLVGPAYTTFKSVYKDIGREPDKTPAP